MKVRCILTCLEFISCLRRVEKCLKVKGKGVCGDRGVAGGGWL